MASSHSIVWQQATVLSGTELTPAIKRIVIRPQHPVPAPPGSHVDVRLRVGAELVTRSYSSVDSDPAGTALAISVFDSEVSRGGAKVMHALRAGDVIDVTQPLQDFPLRLGAPSYTLLAGGVGITAILGMAAALSAAGAEYRIVYCGRAREHMAYLTDLEAAHGDRLQVHVREEGTSLDVAALVDGVHPDSELYMCGPIRLMDAVRRAWVERGHSPSRLRFETFGNSGWFAPERFTVRVPALGLQTVVPPSSTLLEALEAAGADALFDCRKGECGLCEARVIGLEGVIDHRDVFYSERQRDASSRICVCVSRVCLPSGGHAEISLELS
ncbi:PDR/VanB family oxidoreductase [Microbacterium aurantiacum]|uniref:PDR/VanB family oxidoreductase n=1 Tax=Microbacterium aurantiacum TaxID=162393 RepID=UPI000C803E26|nr:PDR/VanB family oxidoreductase [Microbacterium aurantiacum]